MAEKEPIGKIAGEVAMLFPTKRAFYAGLNVVSEYDLGCGVAPRDNLMIVPTTLAAIMRQRGMDFRQIPSTTPTISPEHQALFSAYLLETARRRRDAKVNLTPPS